MRKFLTLAFLLCCSLLFTQTTLVVLPVKANVSPDLKTGLFTSKAKAKAKQDHLSQKARTLTLEFQRYTDEVLEKFELAYNQSAIFVKSDSELLDNLGLEYAKFMGSIDQAIFRNQRKKDDGPLSVSIYPKGYSNKALKEKNETSLRETSKPFGKHFNTNLFLSVKVIGMQNSPLKSQGIYGGIRIQVILIDANTGATLFFKTFSKGTMKTMTWDSKNGKVPPSATSVRKNGFQSRLESMLRAGIDKANKLTAKG